MNMLQICAITGAVLGALPWICAVIQKLLDYWTRGDGYKVVSWGCCVTTFGFYRDFEKDRKKGTDDAMAFITIGVLGASMTYFAAGLGIGALIEAGYLWHTLISAGCLITIIVLPRIMLDVGKSLKYDRKTGNAERIDKLEAEIAKLRGK